MVKEIFQMEDKANSTNRLLISAAELAKMLGASVRHIRRMDANAQLPQSVRLGRLVKWRLEEIKAWIQTGMPNRELWNIKAGNKTINYEEPQ